MSFVSEGEAWKLILVFVGFFVLGVLEGTRRRFYRRAGYQIRVIVKSAVLSHLLESFECE